MPVIQCSGPFRQEAWEVLRGVPAGTVLTHTEYAERSGRPRAVRAAAGAHAFNAAALLVPCHRVVRSDGSPGGFRYGLAIKEGLIARESG
ncbi:methylated-DNA--[protein]-cysteine S-methyltransferase [Actinomyces bowdenii]|uniref:methylated-DNA--[protein]-cysteine S-methyltransferase n=1 Tax=Actinomyces bowdenii TaxID=131109 RepID=UPI00214BD8CF|nr:methylated-DNA--[protein]-cysteine S-methyltransferase [Actinomyces bowdenii]